MKSLKQIILNEGEALNKNVLKVDTFLNHAINPQLMKEIGEEFAKRYKDANITKIITLESSGIAPALMTSLVLDCELVFARKRKSLTLTEGYSSTVYSYTKKQHNEISVSNALLNENDHILIIDDFLANGEAAFGLIDLVNQANATIAGLGIVIEKTFQPGRQKLENQGMRVESLARIAHLSNGKVTFHDEEETITNDRKISM